MPQALEDQLGFLLIGNACQAALGRPIVGTEVLETGGLALLGG
jgi:hypothetical protein